MSKKENEFDRYARMKKMERDSERQKRKDSDPLGEVDEKKGGKQRPSGALARKRRAENDSANSDDTLMYERI